METIHRHAMIARRDGCEGRADAGARRDALSFNARRRTKNIFSRKDFCGAIGHLGNENSRFQKVTRRCDAPMTRGGS